MTGDELPRRSVSALVPIWNEIECLPAALDRIHGFLAANVDDFEILVIESGSTDGSGAACDAFAEGRPRVRVVHEGARRGFGSAVRLGYRHASKDLIWVVTADLPFPLDSLLRALPLFDRFDCVLSYRSEDVRGPLRRAQSFAYNALARALLGLQVRHVNSAFRVYKRSLARSLGTTAEGWLFEAETIYRLQQQGARFTEIPVPIVERTAGRSSVGITTPLHMLVDLARFAASERFGARTPR